MKNCETCWCQSSHVQSRNRWRKPPAISLVRGVAEMARSLWRESTNNHDLKAVVELIMGHPRAFGRDNCSESRVVEGFADPETGEPPPEAEVDRPTQAGVKLLLAVSQGTPVAPISS